MEFEPHLSLDRYRNSSSISRSTARGPPRRNVSGMRAFHHARASEGMRASCCLPRFALGRSTSFFKSATSFWTSRKTLRSSVRLRRGLCRARYSSTLQILRFAPYLKCSGRPDSHAATVVEVVRKLEHLCKRLSHRHLSARASVRPPPAAPIGLAARTFGQSEVVAGATTSARPKAPSLTLMPTHQRQCKSGPSCPARRGGKGV